MDKEKEIEEVNGLIAGLGSNLVKHILFVRNDGEIAGLIPETMAVIKRGLEHYLNFLRSEKEAGNGSTIN